MQTNNRNQHEPYPEYKISKHLLKHQQQMLHFLYFTSYDIVLQSFELKHASYISSTKRGYPVQQFNKQQQIQRHFKMVSEKLHIRLMRDQIALDKILERLQLLWYSRNVPLFHRYYFVKYLYSTFVKSVQQLIQTQEKLIKEEKHVFYNIFKTINARQACLRQLKRHLAETKAQDVYEYLHVARQRFFNQKKKNQHFKLLQKGYKLKSMQHSSNQPLQQAKISKCKLQFFGDNFNHLTKLTLYCIDQIMKWKSYIFSLTHDAKKKRQRLQFYYFQENYFIKILSDNNFFKVSALQKFYQFAPKNDPFLLWPLLAFQKTQIKELDSQLLKNIFMPLQDQLPQILEKIEVLSEEYKWNIRSRKNYNIDVLKKPASIENQKKKLDIQQKEPISNLVLKRIQYSPPKKAKSLKNFRIREQTKQKQILQRGSKDKILIEFKTSPKKRANFLPIGTLKTLKETQNSLLKNSVIVQKNKVNPLGENQVGEDLLRSLKQEVIRKIKQDYDTSSVAVSSNSKDQALEMYINTKISQAIKGIFPYQPQKQLKPPIELTFFVVQESKLSEQVSLMIKHTVELYNQMQYSQAELVKKFDQSPYVYFIKATVGDQYIATVIVSLDRQVEQYKALKTLFIGFTEVSQLQMLIRETTKFVEKYQNAFEIHFPFFQPTANQPVRKLLQTLQKNLTNQQNPDYLPCMVAQKQIYSNIAQTRFIFKRANKNTNYFPNRFPTSMHFKVHMVHSQKKLFLERSRVDKGYGKKVAYDFLLSDILRKVYPAETINILKEKSFSKTRSKQILKTMVKLDKEFGGKNAIRFIEVESISELNKEMASRKEEYPYLQVSDTAKIGNKVHSVSFSGIFTLPYPVTKSIVGDNNEMFYKITVRQRIQITKFASTKFYKFRLKDQKIDKTKAFFPEKFLLLFSAQQYNALNYADLSTYLAQAIISNSEPCDNMLVNQIWIPMVRYPEKYQEREELYLSTQRLSDLEQLKQELYIGQFFEWFCDMPLQNGIKYQDFSCKDKQGVIAFKKPFGIVITSQQNDTSTILYGRVFTNK